MTEAILHVGVHKTGTTSIQRVFARYRPELKAQGFLYPSFSQNHYDIHSAFASEPFKAVMVRARGLKTDDELQELRDRVLGSVEDEVRANPDLRLLICAEDLSALDREGQIRLQAWLSSIGVDQITIHMYVREPISFWESLIQQSIKGGHQIDFTREAEVLSRLRTYEPALEAYAGTFGRDNIRVHLFAPERLAGGDVVVDFAGRIGLNIDGMELVRANESLSRDAMLFLNGMNGRIETYADHGRSMLRDGLLQAARTHKGPKFKASLAVARQIYEKSAPDRAYLAANWFDGEDPFGEAMRRRIAELEASPQAPEQNEVDMAAALDVMAHIYQLLKEENLRVNADRFRLKSLIKRETDPAKAKDFMEKSRKFKRELADISPKTRPRRPPVAISGG
jgi:hypothetical protein